MNLRNPAVRYVFYIAFFCLILSSGCGMFTKIGRDVVGGASEKTDTLARNLVKGLREELADPETKKQISLKTKDEAEGRALFGKGPYRHHYIL